MKAFKFPTLRPSDSVAIVGHKGSGKTELAKKLIVTQRNMLILDTKRTEDWSDVGTVVNSKEIFKVRGGRFVYRVDPEFVTDPEAQSQFFRWCLDRGNSPCFVDELFTVKDTPGLMMLATQGRASNSGLWIGAQRPFNLPLYAMSEPNHFFVFRLLMLRDRQRIEEISGARIPWKTLQQEQFSFYHATEHGDCYGPARLTL